MVKPPPIKPILWSPVKSEKSQKLTKMSFLDFYQYLGLFSMDGRHVPLWERDSACGRGILPVEELFSLWKSSMPVGERFCLWKRCIALGERDSACGRALLLWARDSACGRGLSLWERDMPLWDGSILLEEPYPYGRPLFPEKKNKNVNPKCKMKI